jgi:hypothetical protein
MFVDGVYNSSCDQRSRLIHRVEPTNDFSGHCSDFQRQQRLSEYFLTNRRWHLTSTRRLLSPSDRRVPHMPELEFANGCVANGTESNGTVFTEGGSFPFESLENKRPAAIRMTKMMKHEKNLLLFIPIESDLVGCGPLFSPKLRSSQKTVSARQCLEHLKFEERYTHRRKCIYKVFSNMTAVSENIQKKRTESCLF